MFADLHVSTAHVLDHIVAQCSARLRAVCADEDPNLPEPALIIDGTAHRVDHFEFERSGAVVAYDPDSEMHTRIALHDGTSSLIKSEMIYAQIPIRMYLVAQDAFESGAAATAWPACTGTLTMSVASSPMDGSPRLPQLIVELGNADFTAVADHVDNYTEDMATWLSVTCSMLPFAADILPFDVRMTVDTVVRAPLSTLNSGVRLDDDAVVLRCQLTEPVGSAAGQSALIVDSWTAFLTGGPANTLGADGWALDIDADVLNQAAEMRTVNAFAAKGAAPPPHAIMIVGSPAAAWLASSIVQFHYETLDDDHEIAAATATAVGTCEVASDHQLRLQQRVTWDVPSSDPAVRQRLTDTAVAVAGSDFPGSGFLPPMACEPPKPDGDAVVFRGTTDLPLPMDCFLDTRSYDLSGLTLRGHWTSVAPTPVAAPKVTEAAGFDERITGHCGALLWGREAEVRATYAGVPCAVDVIDDPLGMFALFGVDDASGTVTVRVGVPSAGDAKWADYWAAPYPMRFWIKTSTGSIVAVVDGPKMTRALTPSEEIEHDAAMLAAKVNCTKAADAFWSATHRYNPRWSVDPGPLEIDHQLWYVDVEGLANDDYLVAADPAGDLIAEVAAVDGTARVVVGFDGAHAPESLQLWHSKPAARGREVDIVVRELALRTVATLPMGERVLQQSIGMVDDRRVAAFATAAGVGLVDVTRPALPSVMGFHAASGTAGALLSDGALILWGSFGARIHDTALDWPARSLTTETVVDVAVTGGATYLLTGEAVFADRSERAPAEHFAVDGGTAIAAVGSSVVVAAGGRIGLISSGADAPQWRGHTSDPVSELVTDLRSARRGLCFAVTAGGTAVLRVAERGIETVGHYAGRAWSTAVVRAGRGLLHTTGHDVEVLSPIATSYGSLRIP